MLELIGAAVLAVLAGRGLWWWIHHDGPIRLFADLIAVGHTDETRRRDAREVLGATKNLRSTQKFHRRATNPTRRREQVRPPRDRHRSARDRAAGSSGTSRTARRGVSAR